MIRTLVDKAVISSYIFHDSGRYQNLKNHLSEYVCLTASGETVLVTERDRVVAKLMPPQAGRAARDPDALLADLDQDRADR